MVRGAQKQMVVIKTQDSAVFEEAYFVVRRNAGTGRMDMLAEANRIIDSCGANRKPRQRFNVRLLVISLCCFVGGGAIGATVVGLMTFVV